MLPKYIISFLFLVPAFGGLKEECESTGGVYHHESKCFCPLLDKDYVPSELICRPSEGRSDGLDPTLVKASYQEVFSNREKVAENGTVEPKFLRTDNNQIGEVARGKMKYLHKWRKTYSPQNKRGEVLFLVEKLQHDLTCV